MPLTAVDNTDTLRNGMAGKLVERFVYILFFEPKRPLAIGATWAGLLCIFQPLTSKSSGLLGQGPSRCGKPPAA